MSIKAETGFSLKDQLFNRQSVGLLSQHVVRAYPKFPVQAFTKAVLSEFPNLELKARIDHMAEQLAVRLPEPFPKTLKILHNALPPPLDANKTDDDFGSFIWSVPSTLVAKRGCREEHLRGSLDFLEAATQRFSAEFAIRPFLAEFPEQTLTYVDRWAAHPNYHVRRLASEGIRPYLPWAQRVLLPPTTVLSVLTKLHADSTRFVTRSVANTLNDISKIEPELVIDTLASWQQQAKQDAAELSWMTNHALRSLVKQDNAAALALLGYSTTPKFRLHNARCSPRVAVGEKLIWQGQLTAIEKQKLRLNLRVHFLKANGSHSTKVFAVKDLELHKNQTLDIKKSLAFKPMTTRTVYPGQHYVELVVNVVSRNKQSFMLQALG